LLAAVGVAATVAAVQWMPAHYNAGIEGINGFGLATRSAVSGFALLPVVILGLALAGGWLVGQSKGRTRSMLLWGCPVVLMGVAILLGAGPLPRTELVEAAKWAERQSEASQVRVITEGNHSWEIRDNALGSGPGAPERVRHWLQSAEQIDKNEISLATVGHPALRLLGVKYLISDRRMEPTIRPATTTAPAPTRRLFGRPPQATPMGKMEWKPVWPTTQPDGGVVVYENVSQPLPRFWIARTAQWSNKADEVIERLRKSEEQLDFDPHEIVLLDREGDSTESDLGLFRRPPPARGLGRLELLEDSPERVRIGTEGAGGWLVLADAYAPGWRAKMSYTMSSRGPRRSARERTYERELAIVPAYGAVRAVALAGGAEIVFEYEPKGWKHGLMVAGIGAIVLLLMVGGMMFPARE
jgi:hypothetical protein